MMKKRVMRKIGIYLFLQGLFLFNLNARWVNFHGTTYDSAKTLKVVEELKKDVPGVATINSLFKEVNGKKGADPDAYHNGNKKDTGTEGQTLLHLVAANKKLDADKKINLIKTLYGNKARMLFNTSYLYELAAKNDEEVAWYNKIEFDNEVVSQDKQEAAKLKVKKATYEIAKLLFESTYKLEDFKKISENNNSQLLKVRDKAGNGLIYKITHNSVMKPNEKNLVRYKKPKEIINYLISQGVSVSDRYGRRGLTPLNIAVEKGDKDFFSFLLEKGFPSTSPYNYSLFHSAVVRKVEPQFIKFMIQELRKKDQELLKEHLNHIASVSTKSIMYYFTPLQTAIFNSRRKTELINALLEEKDLIDFNKLNNDNDSALHMAVQRGYLDIVKLLVYSGADPDVPDNFGLTPLHLAANNHSKWRDRYSTLFVSQREIENVDKIIDFLLKNGARINAQTKGFGEKYVWDYFCDGQTPLHFALLREEYDIARLLVEKGADLSRANIRGEIPRRILYELSQKISDLEIKSNPEDKDVRLIKAFRKKYVSKDPTKLPAGIKPKPKPSKKQLEAQKKAQEESGKKRLEELERSEKMKENELKQKKEDERLEQERLKKEEEKRRAEEAQRQRDKSKGTTELSGLNNSLTSLKEELSSLSGELQKLMTSS